MTPARRGQRVGSRLLLQRCLLPMVPMRATWGGPGVSRRAEWVQRECESLCVVFLGETGEAGHTGLGWVRLNNGRGL